MLRKFYLKWISCLSFAACLLAGCDRIDDVNGCFEESSSSGRLFLGVQNAPNLETRRFFRFHLKQFENDVGGIFETFDLSSYDAFSQVPAKITTPYSHYYCGRIEYSYVRDARAHIIWTDKEQRRWVFTGILGDDVLLSGSVNRLSADGISFPSPQADYMLPQDAIYLERGGDVERQIAFEKMKSHADKNLECPYYYKSTTVNVVIPESVLETYCEDRRFCGNLRLGIIGMESFMKESIGEDPEFFEIVSATLHDCDIKDRVRSIILRDNPHVYGGNGRSGFFIATAVIYQDEDRNGAWDSRRERIIAALGHETLIFSDEDSHLFYGALPEGYEYDPEEPLVVLAPEEEWPKRGWSSCTETDYDADYTDYWRVPTKIRPVQKPVYLEEVFDRAGNRGCLMRTDVTSVDSPRLCTGLMPVLLM